MAPLKSWKSFFFCPSRVWWLFIKNAPKSSTLTLAWLRLPASTWSCRIVTSFTLFLKSNGTNCAPRCGVPSSPSHGGAKRAVFTLMQHDKHMQENWQCASVNEVPSLLRINYELRIIAVGFFWSRFIWTCCYMTIFPTNVMQLFDGFKKTLRWSRALSSADQIQTRWRKWKK